MGKTIYAEEYIFSYLKNLSKSNSFTTGLILGQCGQTTDYIIHLARTPESDKAPETSSTGLINIQTVNDIKESSIIDHARHVTRMLPGGLWVLGLFICSPSDVFSDMSAQSRLKNIMYQLKKHLSSDPLLFANSSSPDKLLLHFNSGDHRYTCKTLDVSATTSSFKPAEWKFQNNFTKWYQVTCHFDLDQPSLGENSSSDLKSQLKLVLNEVNKNIDSALVTLDGKVRDVNETLESLAGKKKLNHKFAEKENEKVIGFEASAFIPFPNNISAQDDIEIKNCDVELQLLGVLSSQVFLNQKATVSEAVNAVKQDIVRSLAARLEMHWDSLVEEECGSPEEKETIHEPPRRVSVQLPNSKIAFSDYLFPGEGASEVLSSFKELLDVNINESNVHKDFEVQGDPLEFYEKSAINLSSPSKDKLLRPALPMGFIMAALSIAVILIGIAVALHLQRKDNSGRSKQ